MQAAVVSVLLMAGVCGAPPSDCGCANSQVVVQQSYDNGSGGCTMCDGAIPDGAMRDGRPRSGGLWSPVTPDGTLTYERRFGCAHYSPLWLIHNNATYYPANYAKPYDYREAFGYPWNGPRPLPPQPKMSWPLAPPLAQAPQALPSGVWPAETAALYQRQSQPR